MSDICNLQNLNSAQCRGGGSACDTKILWYCLSYPIFAPIAQVVEQLPFKEWVVGSNPTGRTVNTLPGWVKLFESNWAHQTRSILKKAL